MNYSEITEAAKRYVDRSDYEVSESMDIFIYMAEARINRMLKTYEQTHRIFTATKDGYEYYTLPSDYNGMRSIQFNTLIADSEESKVSTMEYVTPETIAQYKQIGLTGGYYYSIVAQQIQVYPMLPSGGSIEILFYRKVPPLSNQNPTNWCSDNNPDIYLSGICAEIATFVKDYNAASGWDAKMSRAISELKDSDFDKRWTGTPIATKVIR